MRNKSLAAPFVLTHVIHGQKYYVRLVNDRALFRCSAAVPSVLIPFAFADCCDDAIFEWSEFKNLLQL